MSTYICIFFSTLHISLSIQGHEILALESVTEYISSFKNKRNPTRETAPQTDKQRTFYKKTFH